MDRRTSIKWVLAASASWPLLGERLVLGAAAPAGQGYGTDPNMVKGYHPGDFWPLTLTAAQRRVREAGCQGSRTRSPVQERPIPSG